VDHAMADLEVCDIICICTGINVENYASENIMSWMRSENRKGRVIGALSTGTIFMAKAGLLFGKKSTIHWQHIDGFREMFPNLEITGSRYEIDGNLFSCAGGKAVFDLTLSWIEERFGNKVSTAVSDQFLHGVGGKAEEPQINDIVERYGVYNDNLLKMIVVMEENLEEPLTRIQIANSADVTVRQMERLFAKYLEQPPSQFYIQLRLGRAREFIRQTAMPISEVAIACGFVNFSHFAHSYRNQFKCSPTEEREAIRHKRISYNF